MESHSAGFPPFPLLLEIPSGFPHFHRFDDGINIKNSCRAIESIEVFVTARGL
jgi:hypothetical protein